MSETYYCYDGDYQLTIDSDGDLIIEQGEDAAGAIVLIPKENIRDLINGIIMTANNEDLPVGLQHTKSLQEKLEHAEVKLKGVQASNDLRQRWIDDYEDKLAYYERMEEHLQEAHIDALDVQKIMPQWLLDSAKEKDSIFTVGDCMENVVNVLGRWVAGMPKPDVVEAEKPKKTLVQRLRG